MDPIFSFTFISLNYLQNGSFCSSCIVLVISYELFRINVDLINRASEIGLLVVDEGHRLKNSSALTLNALSSLSCDARLLITGTPIQNNLSEFYTLVNFVLPGLLGSSNDFKRGTSQTKMSNDY
jgi:DNA repair and recombination RAD54-like protein